MNKVAKKSSTAIVIVKALLAAYIVSAFILLLLAMIMYKFDPPSSVISVGIIITYLLSTFIAGFILGKVAKQKRFLWGIIVGLLYFLVIFIVSLLMSKDIFGSCGSIITVLCMCGLGGMLGGMLS